MPNIVPSTQSPCQTQIYLVEYKNYLFVLSSHLDEHRPFGFQKPKGPMLVVLVFQIMVRLFFWF